MKESYRGEESEKIGLWFVVTTTPIGGAPIEIKQQWIGVPLPVRQGNIVSGDDRFEGYAVGLDITTPTDIHVREPLDTISVESQDAVKALRLNGRHGAAEWWDYWFETKAALYGNRLMFQAEEGKIYTPAEIEQDFPGAFRFDSTEL